MKTLSEPKPLEEGVLKFSGQILRDNNELSEILFTERGSLTKAMSAPTVIITGSTK